MQWFETLLLVGQRTAAVSPASCLIVVNCIHLLPEV